VLAIAPTPAKAARLTKPQIVAALRRAGRHDPTAPTDTAAPPPRLGRRCFRRPSPRHAGHPSDRRSLQRAPDHQIITSFVGLADVTGARLLAEIGDDRTRFADARALKAFAGSARVTKASGRSIRITHRHVKNNRLAAVGFVWAFVASGCQGPTRAHYLARRDHGDRHPAALRHLYNRMLGQLYHCWQTGQTYDSIKAYGPPPRLPNKPPLDS
jgi:hypothetical protein